MILKQVVMRLTASQKGTARCFAPAFDACNIFDSLAKLPRGLTRTSAELCLCFYSRVQIGALES